MEEAEPKDHLIAVMEGVQLRRSAELIDEAESHLKEAARRTAVSNIPLSKRITEATAPLGKLRKEVSDASDERMEGVPSSFLEMR